MLIYNRLLAFLAILFLAGPSFASATSWDIKRSIPKLSSPITDEIGWLSARQEAQLNSVLQKVYKDTSIQIAVYLIPSLEEEVLEQYSLAVAEKWKLGKADSDKGLLLLVAAKERKLRIEVGQGLEGDIPDVVASQIIRDVIVPRFRKSDFTGGITAGVGYILQKAAPDYKPEKSIRKATRRKKGGLFSSLANFIIMIILLIVFRNSPLSLLLLLGGSSRGGHGGGSFGGGGFSGGGGGFSGGGSSGGW